MKEEIIPITEVENGKRSVNARDLHSFLEAGKDFSNWIKDRISLYGFSEGEDFVIVEVLSSPISGSPKSRPQKLIEYHLSLNMAKELSMVERNEKGKQARQYFIRCEEELQKQMNSPQNFANSLRLLADKIEEAEKLKAITEAQAPAVDFVNRYVKSEGLFGIRETAKILGLQQRFFVDMCIERKVLFRENGSLQSFAGWIDAGYFEVKTGEANDHAFKQTRFTSKGLEWVRRYLKIDALLATSENTIPKEGK